VRLAIALTTFANPPTVRSLSNGQKLSYADRNREEGNGWFRTGDCARAARRYSCALNAIQINYDYSAAERKQVREQGLLCFANRAACYLKLQLWDKARGDCDMVLRIDPDHCKGLFRRAAAWAALGRWPEAKVDLKRLVALEPGNSRAKRDLLRAQREVRAEDEAAREKFGGMFAGGTGGGGGSGGGGGGGGGGSGKKSMYDEKEGVEVKQARRAKEAKERAAAAAADVQAVAEEAKGVAKAGAGAGAGGSSGAAPGAASESDDTVDDIDLLPARGAWDQCIRASLRVNEAYASLLGAAALLTLVALGHWRWAVPKTSLYLVGGMGTCLALVGATAAAELYLTKQVNPLTARLSFCFVGPLTVVVGGRSLLEELAGCLLGVTPLPAATATGQASAALGGSGSEEVAAQAVQAAAQAAAQVAGLRWFTGLAGLTSALLATFFVARLGGVAEMLKKPDPPPEEQGQGQGQGQGQAQAQGQRQAQEGKPAPTASPYPGKQADMRRREDFAAKKKKD
jgi:tetratricopeptide (TPR) repeat protein